MTVPDATILFSELQWRVAMVIGFIVSERNLECSMRGQISFIFHASAARAFGVSFMFSHTDGWAGRALLDDSNECYRQSHRAAGLCGAGDFIGEGASFPSVLSVLKTGMPNSFPYNLRTRAVLCSLLNGKV